MQAKPLSIQQLGFLIFLLLLGSSLVFITGKAAAQDSWIATLLAMGIGLCVLSVIIKLQTMFPGQRITQISTSILGKIPGTILNLLFLWSIFAIQITFLFDIIMVLEIIYPVLPSGTLYSLLILTCVYCLYKGLLVIGRLGELFIWISLLFIVSGFLLALPLIHLANLKPILLARNHQ